MGWRVAICRRAAGFSGTGHTAERPPCSRSLHFQPAAPLERPTPRRPGHPGPCSPAYTTSCQPPCSPQPSVPAIICCQKVKVVPRSAGAGGVCRPPYMPAGCCRVDRCVLAPNLRCSGCARATPRGGWRGALPPSTSSFVVVSALTLTLWGARALSAPVAPPAPRTRPPRAPAGPGTRPSTGASLDHTLKRARRHS